jgi:hypothetical protein
MGLVYPESTAASSGKAQFLVTLDRQHLIDHPRMAAASPLRIGTPGDCLEWLRSRLNSRAGVQDEQHRLSERPEAAYGAEGKQRQPPPHQGGSLVGDGCTS